MKKTMIKVTTITLTITIAFIFVIFSVLETNEERVKQLDSQNNGLAQEVLFVIPLVYGSIGDSDKGSFFENWDGRQLTGDEVSERQEICEKLQRSGYLSYELNCINFPRTEEGEKIIVDYIVQMAMKGYYEPRSSK